VRKWPKWKGQTGKRAKEHTWREIRSKFISNQTELLIRTVHEVTIHLTVSPLKQRGYYTSYRLYIVFDKEHGIQNSSLYYFLQLNNTLLTKSPVAWLRNFMKTYHRIITILRHCSCTLCTIRLQHSNNYWSATFGAQLCMVLKFGHFGNQIINTWQVLKYGAGEGRTRPVGPNVWKMKYIVTPITRTLVSRIGSALQVTLSAVLQN
jgi:hypothetical protein